MAFQLGDIYTASGTYNRFDCWTPQVTKFDTSSFYTWEQDNLPIYDLEERTELLWEKVGFAASCPPAISLVVSADAPASAVGCSSNIFTTVSAAVASLPLKLTSPYIIEVASFGNLGKLELDGISCEASGSLEIINRNFDKSRSLLQAALGTTLAKQFISGARSKYDLVTTVSSSEVSSATQDLQTLGGLSVFSAITDSRFTANANALFSYCPYIGSPTKETHRLSVGVNGASLSAATPNVFDFQLYEESPDSLDEIDTYDTSCFDQITEDELFRAGLAVDDTLTFHLYNNYFEEIDIRNCAGPIFVRHFLANGGAGNTAKRLGFNVVNSEVLLENCAAVLYQKAGFNFVDSKVVITRSAMAYRCYGYDGSSRNDGPWLTNIQFEDGMPGDEAGLRAYNSHVEVSSVFEDESIKYSGSSYELNNTLHFARNSNGMILKNSTLTGGALRDPDRGFVPAPSFQSYLQFEGNTNFGLLSENSVVDIKGRLEFFQNTRGAKLTNTTANLDEFEFENNHLFGLKLNNSELQYNARYGLLGESAGVGDDLSDFTTNKTQFYFQRNGQDIILDNNSSFYPADTSSFVLNVGRFRFEDSHRLNVDVNGANGRQKLPSIEVKNGSYAKFVHLHSYQESDPPETENPVYGDCISVRNSSQVDLHGTSAICTAMLGNDKRTEHYNKAALFVDNNSTCRLMGPTIIARFGVDALATRNSTIEFCPHKTQEALEIDSFGLADMTNHTAVELHATRTCLVADTGSNLVLENLGDYNYTWPNGANGSSILLSGVDYDTGVVGKETSAVTYGGSLQFYPNPNDAADYNPGSPGVASPISFDFDSTKAFVRDTTAGLERLRYITNEIFDPATAGDVSAYTGGGVCLRALNGSKVDVKNVNFHAGWYNATGIIYDSSGAENEAICNRTFIWNIANGSKLNCSYASVSSLYPQDAGYHGPNAFWTSGSNSVAYGLPSGTLDTSTLSVLDAFGSGAASVWPTQAGTLVQYGTIGGYENQGPFRLYVSVDSMANYLKHPGGNSGYVYQVYAQGYQPSGDMQLTDSSVSSIYGKALIPDDSGVLQTSGFYYNDKMIDAKPTDIILDESASNTFANAKNGAMGTSNRKAICTIYSSHVETGGENAPNSSSRFGRGFKSANIFDLDGDS